MLRSFALTMLACLLALTSLLAPPSVRLPDGASATTTSSHAAAVTLRSGSARLLAASPKRRKASELKKILTDAGISAAGIVEKEELERLVAELQSSSKASSSDTGAMDVSLVYQMDCAYAEVDGTRLLVDTGSAVSIISSAAASKFGLATDAQRQTLRSKTSAVVLPCFSVASLGMMLPPGVDGILGIDCLRSFSAAEFDWAASQLRLHAQSEDWGSMTRVDGNGLELGPGASVSMPLKIKRVSAGELPFITCAFGSRADESGRCEIEGLVDTGSPVTMVTPELAEIAKMVGTRDANDDIMTTGVDGLPTRMRASKCDVIALGTSSGAARRVAHLDTVVFAGTCPMMAAVGWQGTPAALLGLDVLRGGVQNGQPKAAASGGVPVGRVILDFAGAELVICE